MSKLNDALRKADEERSNVISPMEGRKNLLNNSNTGGEMRKSWLMWALIVVVVTVFIVFNYQEGKDALPLSEIFPDEEVFPVDVEYEFMQEKVVSGQPEKVQAGPEETQAAIPKETTTQAVITAVPVTTGEPAAYTIQIASFKDKKRAEEALVDIRAKVPSAYIASRDLGAKGIWYRIYAGQFQGRNEAEVTLNDIRKNYDSSFIISPTK